MLFRLFFCCCHFELENGIFDQLFYTSKPTHTDTLNLNEVLQDKFGEKDEFSQYKHTLLIHQPKQKYNLKMYCKGCERKTVVKISEQTDRLKVRKVKTDIGASSL